MILQNVAKIIMSAIIYINEYIGKRVIQESFKRAREGGSLVMELDETHYN